MARFHHDADAALEAVMLALEAEPSLIPDDGRVAFLRARPHEGLRKIQDRLDCQQDFKPTADLLEGAGFSNEGCTKGPYRLVILLPERQRERTLADFAHGFELLAEGGILLVGLHNDWGARRFEGLLADVAGEVQTLSKHHARVFWARKGESIDRKILAEWKAAGDVQRIVGDRFWSCPGVFSWDEIDVGSQFLCDKLPNDLSGAVADFGSGWGFISDHLLRNCRAIKSLNVIEAERVAIAMTERNVIGVRPDVELRFLWSDISRGVGSGVYDFVVMNPPFHEGRQADPMLGARFILAATESLKDRGQLWLVANRNLPYEQVMRECFDEFEIVDQTGGFKILHGSRPKRPDAEPVPRSRKERGGARRERV